MGTDPFALHVLKRPLAIAFRFVSLLAIAGFIFDAAPLIAQTSYSAPAAVLTPAQPASAAPAVASSGSATKAANDKKSKAAVKLPPAPKINVNVTEWVVFVADASRPQLNGREIFHTDLPDFVEDMREIPGAEDSNAQQDNDLSNMMGDSDVTDNFFTSQYIGGPVREHKAIGPSPIGLIRLSPDGSIDKNAKIDVKLSFPGGRALGYWPRAKPRLAGLLWEDLGLNAAAGEEHKLPDGSWLASLRAAGSPLVLDKTRESFLLYDVTLDYPVRLAVSAHAGGKYGFSHTMTAPLHDLTFYKRDADHWQTATLASVKGEPVLAKQVEAAEQAAKAATAAAAAAANQGMQQPRRIVVIDGVATVMGAANASVTPEPAKLPKAKETEFALAAVKGATADDVLAPWREKLAAAGVLTSDQDVVLKILAHYALDSSRLTAIYRIDPAELDRLMPIEVVPQPKKIQRIALVIVRGLDPAMIAHLDELIKQLGNPSWKIRDAAMKAIRKAGIRARTKLQTAAKDKDTEIAYRAEQLLEEIKNAGQGN